MMTIHLNHIAKKVSISHPALGRICAALAPLVFAMAIPAAPVAGSPAAAPGDWPMYLHDTGRSGFNPAEALINRRTVGTLHPWWIRRAGNTISAQVVVVGKTLYWGDWNGYEHATPISGGDDLWRTYLGREHNANCSPPSLGIGSTPALATVPIRGVPTPVLYVGGGSGTFYALNAATGAVIWHHFLGSPSKAAYFLWTSPLVYDGSVFMGVASIGDCPNTPGSVVKFDAATGKLQKTLAIVPRGCTGGDVWGSFAVDAPAGTIYVPTGNWGPCGAVEPWGQSLLELRARDLSVVGAWRIPNSQAISDSDFGSTATFFRAVLHGTAHKMVGVINKNGRYYAFVRDRIERGPVWFTPRLATSADVISPAAWDGVHLYVAAHSTTIRGRLCEATLSALNPATGAVVWRDCLPGGGPEGAVTAVPGLVFAGIGSILYGVNSTTGKVLFSYQDTSYHWFWAPPTVANGVLYAPNSDGRLYAFVPRHGA